jgi:hypothetical protein
MARPEDELALRKELLIARSSLARLRIRQDAHDFRRSLSWREAGTAIARIPAVRDNAFLLAVDGLGRDRVARWLALAGRVLAIAKLATLVLEVLRSPPAGPEESSRP